MVTLRTARFEEEAARFALRYNCEDCGMFDLVRERCRHEWPTEKHRRVAPPSGSSSDAGVPGEGRNTAREVVFCKEFETR